jgi:hypothetical protein
MRKKNIKLFSDKCEIRDFYEDTLICDLINI